MKWDLIKLSLKVAPGGTSVIATIEGFAKQMPWYEVLPLFVGAYVLGWIVISFISEALWEYRPPPFDLSLEVPLALFTNQMPPMGCRLGIRNPSYKTLEIISVEIQSLTRFPTNDPATVGVPFPVPLKSQEDDPKFLHPDETWLIEFLQDTTIQVAFGNHYVRYRLPERIFSNFAASQVYCMRIRALIRDQAAFDEKFYVRISPYINECLSISLSHIPRWREDSSQLASLPAEIVI